MLNILRFTIISCCFYKISLSFYINDHPIVRKNQHFQRNAFEQESSEEDSKDIILLRVQHSIAIPKKIAADSHVDSDVDSAVDSKYFFTTFTNEIALNRSNGKIDDNDCLSDDCLRKNIMNNTRALRKVITELEKNLNRSNFVENQSPDYKDFVHNTDETTERNLIDGNCLELSDESEESTFEVVTKRRVGRECSNSNSSKCSSAINESIESNGFSSSSLYSTMPTKMDRDEYDSKCVKGNCLSSSMDGERKKRRICEIKYAEYMADIFPNEDDRADANDTEFHGRTLAEPGEYPHMAALGYRTVTNSLDFKCGGSLISENYVITAAHCMNLTGQQPTAVRVGDLNLMIDEKYLEPQLRKIRKVCIHPSYQLDSYYYDIALLKLNVNVEFTEFVRPIRLWVSHEIPYTVVHAMGYGATAFGLASTNRLTALNLTIVANDECNSIMPSLPETYRGIIDSQMCARDYEMNRDTCQGDSGGPLQLNLYGRRRRNRKHYHLVGITSYGLPCRSGFPGVYTRVSSFLDWIEQIVWRPSIIGQ